jgi:RNA polymerase subunit RPABC4/transcription elongation factor Spt4
MVCNESWCFLMIPDFSWALIGFILSTLIAHITCYHHGGRRRQWARAVSIQLPALLSCPMMKIEFTRSFMTMGSSPREDRALSVRMRCHWNKNLTVSSAENCPDCQSEMSMEQESHRFKCRKLSRLPEWDVIGTRISQIQVPKTVQTARVRCHWNKNLTGSSAENCPDCQSEMSLEQESHRFKCRKRQVVLDAHRRRV